MYYTVILFKLYCTVVSTVGHSSISWITCKVTWLLKRAGKRVLRDSFGWRTRVSERYRIRGLFGGDFNLAVRRIFIGSPNLNHAVLTHTQTESIYLPFRQIKMTPTLFLNKSPNNVNNLSVVLEIFHVFNFRGTRVPTKII